MKPPLALPALLVSALAGSPAQPRTEPTRTISPADSCAVARPNFGEAATAADRALFAYDVDAPLDLLIEKHEFLNAQIGLDLLKTAS